MARFVEIKSVNTNLRYDGMAKELGCSSSTLQRYSQVINMLTPYRIPTNNYKRRQNTPTTSLDDNSYREHDLK